MTGLLRTLVGALRRPSEALTAQQVNLWLAFASAGTVITGLISWAVGTRWSQLWTVSHAVLGVVVLVLAPAKARGSVSTGLRRGRATRWLSILFGLLVLGAVGLGFVHTSGLWTGIGYWSPLWTHQLLAFGSLPLLVWHVLARQRPRRVDIDRRMLLRGGAAVGVATAIVGAYEVGLSLTGLKGRDRRFTGSFEVGSGDPSKLPTVSWINDRAPEIDRDSWPLRIGGQPGSIVELTEASRPLEAIIDCTGGWWSSQLWDVVPISELLPDTSRSFEVRSATGYSVRFPMSAASEIYVAVGYSGEPLRRGHGAPLRIVAPGRRGPWWVKWVTEINLTDRPWWLQSPFPTT